MKSPNIALVGWAVLILACWGATSSTEVLQKKAINASTEALKIDQSRKAMKLDTTSLFGFSAEGAEVKAYSKDGRYQKFEATFYGETGKLARHYYLYQDSLFLVKQIDYEYTKPIYEKGSVTKREIEKTFDFTKNSSGQSDNNAFLKECQADLQIFKERLLAQKPLRR